MSSCMIALSTFDSCSTIAARHALSYYLSASLISHSAAS
jgi:hypothetical protein